MKQQDQDDETEVASPRQVDFLPNVNSLPVLDASGEPASVSCPHGVIVITQCCDLARGGKGKAHLCPVVLLDRALAREVRTGRSSQYIALPELGEEYFADLGVVGSADHGLLVNGVRSAGVKDESTRHALRNKIGRKFSRYPFPEPLVPMFGVLQKKVREKSGREESQFGLVLDMLATLRVECVEGWDVDPPWNLTLILVTDSGYLPSEVVVGDVPRITIDRASARIVRAHLGTLEMATAWKQLGESIEAELLAKSPGDKYVSELKVEIVDEEDISYGRYRKTIGLDLDDLSEYAVAG